MNDQTRGEVELRRFAEWEDEEGVDQNVPTPPLSPRSLVRMGVESPQDHCLYLDAYVAFRGDVGPERNRPYVPAGLAWYHHSDYVSTTSFNYSYMWRIHGYNYGSSSSSSSSSPSDGSYPSTSSTVPCAVVELTAFVGAPLTDSPRAVQGVVASTDDSMPPPSASGGITRRTDCVLPLWMIGGSTTATWEESSGETSGSGTESGTETVSGPPSPLILRADGWTYGEMLEHYHEGAIRHDGDEMEGEWRDCADWALDQIRLNFCGST